MTGLPSSTPNMIRAYPRAGLATDMRALGQVGPHGYKASPRQQLLTSTHGFRMVSCSRVHADMAPFFEVRVAALMRATCDGR